MLLYFFAWIHAAAHIGCRVLFHCRCGLVVKIPDFGWRDPGSFPGNDTAFLCERSPNLG